MDSVFVRQKTTPDQTGNIPITNGFILICYLLTVQYELQKLLETIDKLVRKN
jgi:hypothetical protein